MNYLQETKMLNYSNKNIQKLINDKGFKNLQPSECVKAIYNFIRDEIKFGYNTDDSIPASKVLRDGYGQCNTKGTLFMALLRSCNIPCRIHGFTIDKKLQKGAMTGFVYKKAPNNILHSWVEVLLDEKWYELEGFILDNLYLSNLKKIIPNNIKSYFGYGVAVKDINNLQIDFNKNNTYIQSEGITNDYGVFDSPDDLLKNFKQNLSKIKKIIYKLIGRHLMNRNVNKIRKMKERK